MMWKRGGGKKITEKYTHSGYSDEGLHEKAQHSDYQKEGCENHGLRYGYSFQNLFMGKKDLKSLVNKLLLRFTCGTRRQLYE